MTPAKQGENEMNNQFDLDQGIENAIQTLIKVVSARDTEPTEDEIIELGERCGVLAIAAAYRPSHSRVEEWEPVDGDLEALNELFGTEDLEDLLGIDREEQVLRLFSSAYKDAARSTVDGIADVADQWS